jgi:hypothetical protein
MDFPKRWDGCRIVNLEQNYRSVPEVLEVANACIKGNPEQFQKTLRPTRKARCKPRVYYVRDGDEQAAALLGLVRRYQEDGYNLRDMAVLYRAHYHSIELQMMLGRARLPYVITSGISVFEQAHVKDVVAFLRVCENRADRMAFSRLLGMLSGVGEKTIDSLWEKLDNVFDTRDPEQRERLCKALKPSARGQWQEIDRLFEEYHRENLAASGGEVVQRFCDVFYHTYLARAYEGPQAARPLHAVCDRCRQGRGRGFGHRLLEGGAVPLRRGDRLRHRWPLGVRDPGGANAPQGHRQGLAVHDSEADGQLGQRPRFCPLRGQGPQLRRCHGLRQRRQLDRQRPAGDPVR